MKRMFLFSILLHTLLFLGLVFPSILWPKRQVPAVIHQVELVSLPQAKPPKSRVQPERKPQKAKEKPEQKKPKKVVKKKKPVVKKLKPVIKKPPKERKAPPKEVEVTPPSPKEEEVEVEEVESPLDAENGNGVFCAE